MNFNWKSFAKNVNSPSIKKVMYNYALCDEVIFFFNKNIHEIYVLVLFFSTFCFVKTQNGFNRFVLLN